MASEKPTMILLDTTDMPREEIAALTDVEAWQLIYANAPRKPRDNRLQVCLTGFRPGAGEGLAKLANANGFKVVGSVTKKLDFLVYGENAGPKKIEKAQTLRRTALGRE